MKLAEQIERVKTGLRQRRYISEAAVSQGIVLPVLNELGWETSDTSIVIPEYSVESRRVDFAMCPPDRLPSAFVEVKKGGRLSEEANRQLFEYAFHVGVPMAILTDGKEWLFYLPGEQGHYSERRVDKLDLLERNPNETIKRLRRYLSYERVRSGEAIEAARSDYQEIVQNREIKKTFPQAWNTLLEERDSLLLEMLAEKVKDLCGYEPELEACGKFLESIPQVRMQEEATSSEQPSLPSLQQRTRGAVKSEVSPTHKDYVSTLSRFFTEKLEPRKGEKIRLKKLKDEYESWCRSEGDNDSVRSSRHLRAHLEESGYTVRNAYGKNGRQYYIIDYDFKVGALVRGV